jgi:hypothetical protein
LLSEFPSFVHLLPRGNLFSASSAAAGKSVGNQTGRPREEVLRAKKLSVLGDRANQKKILEMLK